MARHRGNVREMLSLSEDGPESKRKSIASAPRWKARQESKTEVRLTKAKRQARRSKLIQWAPEATEYLLREL